MYTQTRAGAAAGALGWLLCLCACSSAHDVEDEAASQADAGERSGGARAGGKARGGSAGSAGEGQGGRDGAAGLGPEPAGAEGEPAGGAGEPAVDPTTGLLAEPESPVFDQGTLRHYEVSVDPGEWAHINETAYLEQYIQGSVLVDGEVYEPIALRFKGFRGSLYNCFDFDEQGNALGRTCDRLSMKLSFNEYDDAGRFHGLKKLNFHAMKNDSSLMRERLSSWLFRQFQVPAPRVVHATIAVNGEDLGLYALVEEVDSTFSRARFADGGKGNLYKERWPMSSADPAYFESGLASNKNDVDLDVTPMVRFAEALMAADDDTVEAVLRERTEFDAIMRYLAVDRAIQHWDGFTAFRCQPEADVPPLPPEVLAAQTPPLGWEVCQNKNFFWYEGTDDDRMWLVAWDFDVTFSAFSQFPDWSTEPTSCEIRQQGRPPRCDRLIDWLATVLRPYYVQAGEQLLAGPFQRPQMQAQLDQWYVQIAPYVDAFSTQLGASSLSTQIDKHRAELIADLAR